MMTHKHIRPSMTCWYVAIDGLLTITHQFHEGNSTSFRWNKKSENSLKPLNLDLFHRSCMYVQTFCIIWQSFSLFTLAHEFINDVRWMKTLIAESRKPHSLLFKGIFLSIRKPIAFRVKWQVWQAVTRRIICMYNPQVQ